MGFWLSVSEVASPFLPYIVFIILVLLGIGLLLLLLWLIYKIFKNIPAIFKFFKGIFFSSQVKTKEKRFDKKSLRVLLPGSPSALTFSSGIKKFFKTLKQDQKINGKTVYDVRFLLLIGAEPNFMANSDLLSQASNAMDIQDANEDTVIFWSLGDIIIVQPSEKILKEKQIFGHLLAAIQRYRYQRPMDGILMAQDFENIAKTSSDYDFFISTQREISKVLKAVQSKYSITLPIYFLISGLERTQGFEDFLFSIPPEAKHQILGWSAKKENSFVTEEMVTDAFESIVDVLTQYYLSSKDLRDMDTSFVVLFLKQLHDLALPTARFLADIFNQQRAYSFYVRGIYLTGELTTDVLQRSFDVGRPIHTRGPAFMKDLLEEKVSSEASLIELSLNSRNNNYASWLFVLKRLGVLVMLLSVLSAPFTTYFFVDRVERTEVLLKNFQDLLFSSKKQSFSAQAMSFFTPNESIIRDIFEKTSELYDNRLFSLLLPPSWISSIDGDVKKIAQKVLKHYLFDYLPQAFLHKVESDIANIYYQRGQDFKKLEALIEELYAVQSNMLIYRDLKDSVNEKDLHTLLHFVFDLPKEAYGFLLDGDFHNDYFEGLELPDLDHESIEAAIFNALDDLSKQAIEEVYIKSPLLVSLKGTVNIVDRIGSLATDANYQDLLTLNQHIDQINALVNYKDYDWLTTPIFKQSPKIVAVLSSLGGVALVGINRADQIRVEAQKSAELARDSAENLKSLMIGDVLYRDQDGNLVLSEDFEKFALGIKEIFKKRFIAGKRGGGDPAALKNVKQFSHFDLEKYSNAPLTINPASLNEAVQLINEYQLFFGSESYGFNPLFLKGLTASSKQLVINNLYNALDSVLEVNNSFYKDPNIATREALVEKKINTLRADRKNISTVFEFLKNHNKTDRINQKHFQDFMSIFDQYLFSLLDEIDTLLSASNLYNFLFDYVHQWDGGQYLFYELEDASSGKLPVTERIIATRKKLSSLYNDYAAYVLEVLSEIEGVVRTKDQMTLLDKWLAIGGNLKKYDESVEENNSLLAFEEFIRKETLQLRVKDCPKFSKGDGASLKSDYFGSMHNNLVRDISRKCAELTKKNSYQMYEELLAFYNQNIFQHFPFAFVLEPNNMLSLIDFRNFLERFEKFYEYYERNPDIFTGPTQEWVQQMRLVIQTFSNEQGEIYPNLKVELDFEFRAFTLAEGADQVIEWEVKMGNQTVSDKSDRKLISWFYQLPLTVKLRWAKNSDFAPVPFSALNNYYVQEETKSAIFRFNSPWSLFELFYRHGLQSDARIGDQPGSVLLSFQVPTASPDGQETQTTTAYITMRFPNFNDVVTYFPFSMPVQYKQH